jgi:magnesium transporter
MNPDEAADLIASLEPSKSKEVLEEMEHREASEVQELMRFHENTAGGMMTTEMVVVGEDATRGEVVDYIRFHEIGVDQIDNVILINRDAALAGTVPLGRLLLADTEQRMSELTSEPLLSIAPDTKDKDVFELFDKYNLRSLTVINEHNHPIGSITVDDVVSKMRAKL